MSLPPEARRIALDSAPIIYHLEGHPELASSLRPVFRSIEEGERSGIVSTLAFLEVLVGSYRAAGAEGRPAQAAALLATFPNLEWVEVDIEIAHRAAEIRARHGLRTPDAIHVATAVHAGADLLLTNDRGLRRVEEVPIVLVEELGG